MRFQRIAIPAVVAAGLAALPVAAAKAQPYYPYPYPCHPFPLFWPFCAVGAIVGGVGAIVTAPFRGAFYPYYPGYYYGSPWSYYYPGPYYGGPYDTDGLRLPYACGLYGYCRELSAQKTAAVNRRTGWMQDKGQLLPPTSFAKVSRKPMVRLNTGRSGVESGSRTK